jgi:DNA/RNA endonuclease YhcR with UshA esterase domain
MDDKTLVRLSAAIAVVGLIGIIAAAQFAEPKAVEISEISGSLVGQNVAVNGTVESISINDGNVFITLGSVDSRDNSSADVVMFERDARNSIAYTIKKGDTIVVDGKVNYYRNDVEVVASSIRRV